MQDVSRVTGDPIVIQSKIKGRDFILRGMTFEDLGVLQKIFLREKRKRIIEAAQIRAESDLPESRNQILDKAQSAAAEVAYLSDAEFQSSLRSPAGIVEFLWVLFERQHPGSVSRTDLLRMVTSGEFPADTVGDLVSDLFTGSSEGNSRSQGGTAA